jgi:membrane fusion protein (multidrug efflux system)
MSTFSFNRHRHIIVYFAFGLIVGLLTVSLIFKVTGGTLKKVCEVFLEDSDNAHAKEGRLVNIEADVVKTGTMTKRINAVGKTRANAWVVIKSEMSGRIKEILFTEGGTVSKDQEILKFEDTDAQAELKEAEATLALKKADFDRTSRIYEQKFSSTKDFDKARAELDASAARVELAKSKLSKTVIKSPHDGTIGLIDVSVGAYVQSAQELVTIVDSSPMKIDFRVPEKFVHDVGVGQTAEIRIDAFKDRIFHATVEAVDAKVDSDSHSIALRGSTENDDNALRAGLFSNVSLIVGERGNTVMVDESCVDRQGNIEFVWVVEKGKARQKPVRTGVREKNMVEITNGLNAGELIVTAGQLRLSNGVRVKIVNMPDEEAVSAPDSTDDKPPESKDTPDEKKEGEPNKQPEINKAGDVKPSADAKPVDSASSKPQEAPSSTPEGPLPSDVSAGAASPTDKN